MIYNISLHWIYIYFICTLNQPPKLQHKNGNLPHLESRIDRQHHSHHFELPGEKKQPAIVGKTLDVFHNDNGNQKLNGTLPTDP